MEQIDSDWQRREELIDELLAMDADKRAAFIDAIESESPRDAAALRKWLKGIEQPIDYLDPPPPAFAITQGDLVSNWRVLSPIGRGGMGEVWLGERADGLFEKKVAIKFIRSDRADLRNSIESERRLLAGLQHPGIVRLLDAGVTSEGHAFLVTDFIDGTTLDVWLEQRKPPLAQRLDLLHQVAEAVAYAHESLVIHRDIKPRNILVDGAGRAYLLDFGIARALADESDALHTTNLILTPEFAAPELIVENVASIRSDIYALGGLLYFLLCGKPPLSVRGQPLLDAIKIIRDQAPPHAGDIAQSLFPTEPRRLLADLDAIALKALAKSPRERYGTVEALLSDIDAARSNRPIQAKRPDVWDRARRYLHRHKLAVAVAAVLAMSLLAGMAGTLWQAHEARLQSARAESEAARAIAAANNANAVRDFLVDVFGSTDPNNTLGKVPTAADLLDNGVRRIDAELKDQPELQVQLLNTMGLAYGGLAQTDTAADTLRRARMIAVAAFGESSALAIKTTLNFAHVTVNRSSNHRDLEDLGPWLEKIVKQDSSLGDPAQRIEALTAYGSQRRVLGNPEQAEAYLREAVALGRAIAPKGGMELASALEDLHKVANEKGHVLEAIDLERESLAVCLRLYPEASPAVTESQRNLASMLIKVGKSDEAAELMEKVLKASRTLYGESNPEYAVVLTQFAIIRDRQGRPDEAETMLLQALDILKKTGQESALTAMNTYNMLAVVKVHQKDPDQAIQYERAALAISTKAFSRTAMNVIMQRQNLAALEAMTGAYAKAELDLRDVLALHKEIGSDNVAETTQFLGYVRRLRGDPAVARELHMNAISLAKKLRGEDSDVVFKLYAALAADERDLEQFDQARADAETARNGMLKIQHDPNTPDAKDIRYLLAEIDVLQDRCAASAGELESTWKRRKEMKDTPMNRWQAAEAGMFLGLCRKQTNHSVDAETQSLLATNIHELRTSQLPDPYIKRLAVTAATSK